MPDIQQADFKPAGGLGTGIEPSAEALHQMIAHPQRIGDGGQ
jgi:hypothetical protein